MERRFFSANKPFCVESTEILRQTFFCIEENISNKLFSILYLIHTQNRQTICEKALTDTKNPILTINIIVHLIIVMYSYDALGIWMT